VSRLAPTLAALVSRRQQHGDRKQQPVKPSHRKLLLEAGTELKTGVHRTAEPRMTQVGPQQTHRVTNRNGIRSRCLLMSIDPDAAARRIMNQFGEESRIPYLNIEEGTSACSSPSRSSDSSSRVSPVSNRSRPAALLVGSGFGVAVIYVSCPPERVDVGEGRLSVRQATASHVQCPRNSRQ